MVFTTSRRESHINSVLIAVSEGHTHQGWHEVRLTKSRVGVNWEKRPPLAEWMRVPGHCRLGLKTRMVQVLMTTQALNVWCNLPIKMFFKSYTGRMHIKHLAQGLIYGEHSSVVNVTRRKSTVGILETKGKTSGQENQIIPLDITHLSLSSVHHPVDHS